jgi:cytochrome c peroxidase
MTTPKLNYLTSLLTAVNSITTGAPLEVKHMLPRNQVTGAYCGARVWPDQSVSDPAKVTCAACLNAAVEYEQIRLDDIAADAETYERRLTPTGE